jgi:hypothetical protein
VSKKQFRFTRFSCFVAEEGSWKLMEPLLLIAVFVSIGLGFIFKLSEIGLNQRVICIVIAVSPLVAVVVFWFICYSKYKWACKLFVKKFDFWPYLCREMDVLKKLKKIALELEKEFKKSETIEDLDERTNFILIAKGKFWPMWDLAKAFGFPVFQSWRIHAHTTI